MNNLLTKNALNLFNSEEMLMLADLCGGDQQPNYYFKMSLEAIALRSRCDYQAGSLNAL